MKKIEMQKNKCITILFILIISVPLLLSLVSVIENYRIDRKLKGNFENYHYPNYNFSSYLDGIFQKDFTLYWNNNFAPRGIIISLYNQIRYSAFNEGNRIIGNNNNIFEESYIDDALVLKDEYNYSLSENENNMLKYVNELQQVNDKLNKYGKKFLVYTTPNKAIYNIKDIPNKYFILGNRTKNKIRAIMSFRRLIKNTNINYIDSSTILDSDFSEPIFYSTGIHWSRTAEIVINQSIMNCIDNVYKKNIKKIIIGNSIESDKPFWRDDDVFQLLNIFTEPKKEKYYNFEYNIEYPQNYWLPNVLIQGGSFAEGLVKEAYDEGLFGHVYNIFYNYAMRENGLDGNISNIKNYNELDMQKIMDNTDLVIIEMNESVINQYSYGFVQYLNDFLDNYKPNKHSTIKDIENFNPSIHELYDFSNLKGVYQDYEWNKSNYAWTEKNSIINLKNQNIRYKGLEIVFNSPNWFEQYKNDLNKNDEVKVYVNGSLVYNNSVFDYENSIIIIPPEKLVKNSDNYCVEFVCPISFIPKELGINNDMRQLSLQLSYVGERR